MGSKMLSLAVVYRTYFSEIRSHGAEAKGRGLGVFLSHLLSNNYPSPPPAIVQSLLSHRISAWLTCEASAFSTG